MISSEGNSQTSRRRQKRCLGPCGVPEAWGWRAASCRTSSSSRPLSTLLRPQEADGGGTGTPPADTPTLWLPAVSASPVEVTCRRSAAGRRGQSVVVFGSVPLPARRLPPVTPHARPGPAASLSFLRRLHPPVWRWDHLPPSLTPGRYAVLPCCCSRLATPSRTGPEINPNSSRAV